MTKKQEKFLFYFVLFSVVIPGAISFVVKVASFFMVESQEGLAGFALPYFNYLFLAIGFLFLFIWAYLKGHFDDIEKPAKEMLEMDEHFEKLWEMKYGKKKD